MKIFSRLFIVVYSFILLSNCKQNSKKDKKEIITIQETNKPVEHKAKLKGLLDKNQFITSEWIEIEKSKSTFENSIVKEEWLSFVKIISNDKAKIVLMEPVEYELDSIQATKDKIILHVKGAGWTYQFYWVDKSKKIGRWDYVYDKKIDSSFSIYAINKNFKQLLD